MTNQFAIALALSCFIIAMAIFSLPAFKFLDNDANPKRTNSLDGMRFILASLVILHHMDCFYSFYTTGKWGPISYLLYAAGKYGVALFFMTTSYLFWGRIRMKESIDWISLYKGRALRIMPLAMFASFIAIILLFIFTEPLPSNKIPLSNILSWFDGSLWESKPQVTTLQRPTIALAGVTWTLKWEWMFYFTLPAMFFFNKKPLELSLALFAFSIYIMPNFVKDAYLWSFFFAGMLCKEIKERVSLTTLKAEWLLVISIALITIVDPTLFHVPGTFFVAIIFFSLISGGSIFGLLKTKAAIRLGTISYSLYLTQGLVLFPAYNIFREHFSLHLNIIYFIFLCVCFVVISIFSTITYHFIEVPFMRCENSENKLNLKVKNIITK